MKVLYTGFKGKNNSSYQLLSKISGHKLFLTNSFKGLEKDIMNVTDKFEGRMKGLAEFIQMKAFDAKRKIPSTIIDQYVEQIIFDKGVFTWILNPALGNQYQRLSIDSYNMETNY